MIDTFIRRRVHRRAVVLAAAIALTMAAPATAAGPSPSSGPVATPPQPPPSAASSPSTVAPGSPAPPASPVPSAMPEVILGSPGHFDFHDRAYAGRQSGVTCTYLANQKTGTRRLQFMFLKPPRAWWPDLDPTVDGEHGRVAFHYHLEMSTQPGVTPWIDVSGTTPTYVERRTAHEDQPSGDRKDAAPFSILFAIGGLASPEVDPNAPPKVRRAQSLAPVPQASFRLIGTLTWFGPDGDVVSSVSHWWERYATSRTPGIPVLYGSCPRYIPPPAP